ncbi:ABC transporter permease [Haloferax mediterranei ATCC 33500]|uniref:ABC transporter permease n=1 Tax=Haloferax mediterranei (strain ATCC 33500 / DSM 1411 / JCM 8866 / NBRC 14739 / NCIMB 2177 / R-4) TaxID=523841 RepID=I3R4M2_HALMT|nr:ABC transporter permease [Haloferax mediterranei]AFK19182.1 ABC-type ribose transport system, permease protein [Haloferax mediterranei ATCC 33500]EMA03915.1 ABC-type ribose transport system, permease protein [Haloferax mediterranei ATCC 33500]MDX5989281.1 ABC transporter permease [Haloferax mediterranei ATCC 33500]QCQ75652.1 ABC transporter permease [Haloferax mediterranei ATCC 33500]
MSTSTIDQLRDAELSYRTTLVGGAVGAFLLIALLGLLFPSSIWASLLGIITSRSTLSSALRLSVPITFAALGGIFAEKSGVINIGLEGLLIISAFTAVITTAVIGPGTVIFTVPVVGVSLTAIWIGFFAGILVSVLFSAIFAVVCIRYKADQIIAGLAVWLIALGLAPFVSTVYYGGVNTENLGTSLGTWAIPVLSEIPFFGALFSAGPAVYMMLVAVPASWFILNRTAFGRHIRASGENPKALDTVGVDVSRVRYAGALLSGFLSGIGGSALSLGLGQFIGTNQTMVNGKGFIAIVAYLFGNYNPLGAFGASFLFAGLDAVQIRLQQVQGYTLPDSLIQTIPYITVIVILAFVGRTYIPSAAGEHYDSGEDNR